MADKPKPGAAPPPKDHFQQMVFLLFGFAIFLFLVNRVLALLNIGAEKGGGISTIWQNIVGVFVGFWPFVKIFSVVIVVVCSIGIVYSYRKLLRINEEEHELYGLKPEELPGGEELIMKKNERWDRVTTHINSPNSADWRLAIIEADVMLEELLRSAGYHGGTLGEMLKGVEKSDFLTVEAAWEAHKVRNRIAHGGGDFQLNEREAKHVIALFESVFKEFKLI